MDGHVLRSRALRTALLVLAGLAVVWTAPSVSGGGPMTSSALASSHHSSLASVDLALVPHHANATSTDHVRVDPLAADRSPHDASDREAGAASLAGHRALRTATHAAGPRAPPLAG